MQANDTPTYRGQAGLFLTQTDAHTIDAILSDAPPLRYLRKIDLNKGHGILAELMLKDLKLFLELLHPNKKRGRFGLSVGAIAGRKPLRHHRAPVS